MPLPNTKQEFADWILRRLGAPVINVEISDVQLEDVIDEAVQWYQEWHYDGSQRSYRVIDITPQMLAGNNRPPQQLTAYPYNAATDYKIGDRVMYNDNIWIKVDSEQRVRRWVYTVNTAGNWFSSDPYDNPALTDSDGPFVRYDSDLHNQIVYTNSTTGAWTLDSDGNYRLYDSDRDTGYIYIARSTGNWVDSEILAGSGNFDKVLYDSEVHVAFTYVSNPLGDWVQNATLTGFQLYDSENTFVGQQRFTRSGTQPKRYIRDTVINVRYSRETKPLGLRYIKDSEEQDKSVFAFTNLFKKEDAILAENPVEASPYINIDYSIQGQIGLPVPDDVIAVTKCFRIDTMRTGGMWDHEYQFFLNNFDWFYGGAGEGAMSSYYTKQLDIGFLDFMLNTQPAIRFNKHKNRLYIDTDWAKVKRSSIKLMVEVYEITDPDTFGNVYKDIWLKRYATALAKMQWGSNLKKYQNTELPGGIQLSGQELYDEAKEEVEKLEEQLRETNMANFDSILIG